jgi:predicted ATPase
MRPDFTPDWSKSAPTAELSLVRLSPEHVAAMLQNLFGQRLVPAQLVKHVVHRTDGVPLFVEEIARLLLDGQTQQQRDSVISSEAEEGIPDSLQELLMARSRHRKSHRPSGAMPMPRSARSELGCLL